MPNDLKTGQPLHPKHTVRIERWTIVVSFVSLFGIAAWFTYQQIRASGGQLLQSGPPVGIALGIAAVIGLIASLIIYRTPHDGSTEL